MKNYLKYLILPVAIVLGLFFIYKGLNKHWMMPCKVYGPESTIPVPYQQVITAFCESGFLKLVGALQIFSGILLLIPRTRIMGAILLFPIILNIFLIHLFLDNRPEELLETGLPLLANIVIIGYHYKQWLPLVKGA